MVISMEYDPEEIRQKSTSNRIIKGLPIDFYDFMAKERKDVKDFIDKKGYHDFLPFAHGTSKTNAEKIMQEGLKPREQTKMGSVWTSENLESEEDKVYFARCQDTRLPFNSALRASKDPKDARFLLLENIAMPSHINLLYCFSHI